MGLHFKTTQIWNQYKIVSQHPVYIFKLSMITGRKLECPSVRVLRPRGQNKPDPPSLAALLLPSSHTPPCFKEEKPKEGLLKKQKQVVAIGGKGQGQGQSNQTNLRETLKTTKSKVQPTSDQSLKRSQPTITGKDKNKEREKRFPSLQQIEYISTVNPTYTQEKPTYSEECEDSEGQECRELLPNPIALTEQKMDSALKMDSEYIVNWKTEGKLDSVENEQMVPEKSAEEKEVSSGKFERIPIQLDQSLPGVMVDMFKMDIFNMDAETLLSLEYFRL